MFYFRLTFNFESIMESKWHGAKERFDYRNRPSSPVEYFHECRVTFSCHVGRDAEPRRSVARFSRSVDRTEKEPTLVRLQDPCRNPELYAARRPSRGVNHSGRLSGEKSGSAQTIWQPTGRPHPPSLFIGSVGRGSSEVPENRQFFHHRGNSFNNFENTHNTHICVCMYT